MSSRCLENKLKYISGIDDFKLDNDNNLIYVGRLFDANVCLPDGIRGLRGTCFSGLSIETLTLSSDLEYIDSISLANCNKLKKIYLYNNQVPLIYDILMHKPDLEIEVIKDAE